MSWHRLGFKPRRNWPERLQARAALLFFLLDMKKGRVKPRPTPKRLNGQCQDIPGQSPEAPTLVGLKIVSRVLAATPVLHDIEAELLTFDNRA